MEREEEECRERRAESEVFQSGSHAKIMVILGRLRANGPLERKHLRVFLLKMKLNKYQDKLAGKYFHDNFAPRRGPLFKLSITLSRSLSAPLFVR